MKVRVAGLLLWCAGLGAAQGPAVISLKDALALAERNDPGVTSANTDALVARQDVQQARLALYPTVSGRSEYIGSQGNGKISTSRYVTQDGVHVYREWLVVHEDLSAGSLKGTGADKAAANEALARAKVEVARRGLAPAVTRAYYTLAASQRKYATAQQALDEAEHALKVSQNLETGGEVAHSDVVKSQMQENAQQQALAEAKLRMAGARLDLAALLYRDLSENFSVVDDLDLAPALPPLADVLNMGLRGNPSLSAAGHALQVAKLDVTSARQAYWPTLSMDAVYGEEANAIGLHSTDVAYKELGPVPTFGYYVDATLNIPILDWGQRRSKVRQAELKQEQASSDLSVTQRTLTKNLRDAYEEAEGARQQLDLLRKSVDLALENLRLNNLRYQAGEAAILELVDAQSSVVTARNAYDDGMVRYRVAVSTLESLAGNF